MDKFQTVTKREIFYANYLESLKKKSKKWLKDQIMDKFQTIILHGQIINI